MIAPRTLAAALVLCTAPAAPALACLPPPPGTPEPPTPTPEEQARGIFNFSTDIVYGVVTGVDQDEGRARFKILHVYKGALKPGTTVSVELTWGFDAPPCLISPPPPPAKGDYGVIAFRDTPALHYLGDQRLGILFDQGLLQSARRPR